MQPTSRIACLLVPDLPLAAERRAHPELVDLPVVVVSGPEPRAEVVSVSEQAARHGIRPLMTTVHARAACAGLVVRVASPALDHAARGALLDAALSTSPRAEAAPRHSGPRAGEAAVYLDASGVTALFRSERGFAGALAARARGLGLPGRVAIAGSREVAHLAARRLARAGEREAQTLVVPPGEDARFLAPLSLDLLELDDPLATRLARFGLRRIGDLTRLPPRALLSRLGACAAPLLALARGEHRAPPPPAPTESRLEEGIDFERPVDRSDGLVFPLRGLLDRLVARLECRGLAVGDLELELGLDGSGRDARRVGLAAPTRDVRVLLRLVTLSLETRPPRAAIDRLLVATDGRVPDTEQLDFFRPAGPAPAVLSRTVAELEALCGPGRVGAPALRDSHRPDAFALEGFQPGSAPPHEPSDAPRPTLAVRALRPPVPAQVHAPHGHPESLRSAVGGGAVLQAAGPWRTTGAWWSETERFAFDHYDVWTEDGSVIRLRFDLVHRRWEVDAIYD